MNFNNENLIEEIKKIINDDEYVSMINEISSAIFNYYKAANGNYKIIEQNYLNLTNNNFQIIEQIKLIMSTFLANNDNLDNFISDMKISFKKLKGLRNTYLNKVANSIFKLVINKNSNNNNIKNNNIKNNNIINNTNINLNNYQLIEKKRLIKILNLIISFNKYNEILECFPQEQKEEFQKKISIIINELKKSDYIFSNNMNNMNNINNMSPNKKMKEDINKLKYQLNERDKKIKELELHINELIKINNKNEIDLKDKEQKLLSLNEELKSINLKYNNINKENEKNIETINNMKSLMNDQNNSLNNQKNKINEYSSSSSCTSI